jgi:hypothetical protein
MVHVGGGIARLVVKVHDLRTDDPSP